MFIRTNIQAKGKGKEKQVVQDDEEEELGNNASDHDSDVDEGTVFNIRRSK